MNIDELEEIVEDLKEQVTSIKEKVEELDDNYEALWDDLHTSDDEWRDNFLNLESEINKIKKILGLAMSPSREEREQFQLLREAFEKYEFTRKLVLGDDEDNNVQ